jgi:hypothetical protein
LSSNCWLFVDEGEGDGGSLPWVDAEKGDVHTLTGSWLGLVCLLNVVRYYIYLSLRMGGRIDLREKIGVEREIERL